MMPVKTQQLHPHQLLALCVMLLSISSNHLCLGFPLSSPCIIPRVTKSSTLYRLHAMKNNNQHTDNSSPTTSSECDNMFARRDIFSRSTKMAATVFVALNTGQRPAMAKTGQVKTSQYAGRTSTTKATSDPKEAFQALLKARDELIFADTEYLKKKDIEGLRSYFMNDVAYINAFEGYALAILGSKLISDEDKKEIGTIRRYGIGADVMIMYGGLMAEVDEMNDEPDPAVISKFLRRALDSLNEVIQICVNNGF